MKLGSGSLGASARGTACTKDADTNTTETLADPGTRSGLLNGCNGQYVYYSSLRKLSMVNVNAARAVLYVLLV
jgi:hypothetical protein